LSTGGAISGASLSTSGTISAGTNLTVGGTLTATGNISSSGTVTGTQFIRPGGTANQFLMADGSVRNSLISEGFIGSPENNKRGIAIGANTPSAVLHVDVSNYDESSNYNGAMITSTNKDTYLKINSNNSPASAALRNSALIISRNDLGAWFFGLTSVNNNLNIQSISQSAAFVGINNSAPAYLLDVNGDIAATKKVFSFGVQLASDARLKRNIKPITNAIELIKKFRAVGYDKRENIKSETYAEHEYGFIAQEVQKVLPELVKVGNDKDKILSVNYNSLIPILTKGMQEQENKIREQEQLIQSLLKRIEKLEKK
jgi:hypothetical protein